MKLVFFTDLDGTLLDHQTYEFDAAKPALKLLQKFNIPLVLASSKTAAELIEVRNSIGFERYPAIVENGAGVLRAGSERIADTEVYEKIRTLLDQLPAELRKRFTGFGDMSDTEVADVTGLRREAASLAKSREYTEPGVFAGGSEDKNRFLAALQELGLSSTEGGRFTTLSFGCSKVDRMKELTREFAPDITVALGDAPNDRHMISAADIGIVIRNDHSPPVGEIPNVVRSKESGPQGWNTEVHNILLQHGIV